MVETRVDKAYLNPDRPLDLEIDDDRLSFKDIAEIASAIIKKPERPFTFGLFGKWGTGKSTILKYIEKIFTKDKEYVVVTFDAWKYEGDALRRSFIMDISRQLEKNNILRKGYTKALEKDTYESASKPETRLRWKNFVPFIIFFAIGLALAVISQVTELTDSPINHSALIFSIVGVAGAITQLINPSSVTSLFIKKINFSKDKLSSPEEFYTKFTSILEKIKKKQKSLIVIIDNLDRTQKEATVRLLGTIKTFLNSDNGDEDVVFVIASDQDAIKRHIKTMYASDPGNEKDAYESEEFLKKFFNAIIELPPFISSEYGDYINDLLKKTNLDLILENQDNIARIVSLAYPDNPRGAKQFVNNLVVFLLMMDSIGGKSGIEYDFIKSNLNFITVMLVLRDKFAEVYEVIRHSSVNNEMTWSEIKKSVAYFYNKNENDPKQPDYELFNQFTQSWAVPQNDSVRWFFTMRRSREENILPNWDPFIRTLDKADHESARKYLDDFLTNNQSETIRLIDSEVNTIAYQTRWNTFIVAFLFVYINSQAEFKQPLLKILKLVFRNFPDGEDLHKVVSLINLKEILDITVETEGLTKPETQKVKDSVRQLLGEGVDKAQYLQVLAYLDSIEAEDRKLATGVVDRIATSTATMNDKDLLSALVEINKKYKENLIALDYATNVANTLPAYDNVDPEYTVTKLLFLTSTPYRSIEITGKVYELINALQSSATPENLSRITPYIYDYLSSVDGLEDLVEAATTQQVTSLINNWSTRDGDWNQKKNFIPVLLLLSMHSGNPHTVDVRNRAEEFVDSSPDALLIELLDKLDPAQYDAASVIVPHLKTRLQSQPGIFLDNRGAITKWIKDDETGRFETSLLDQLQSLPDEQKFEEGIELAILLKDSIDNDVFVDKLFFGLENSVETYPNTVRKYAYKVNDNPLKAKAARLRDLKKKAKETQEKQKETQESPQ